MEILRVLKEMLTSKKFVSAIAATIVTAAARIGLEIPVEDLALVLTPIIGYILSQGIADIGKGAKLATWLCCAVLWFAVGNPATAGEIKRVCVNGQCYSRPSMQSKQTVVKTKAVVKTEAAPRLGWWARIKARRIGRRR